MWAYPGVDQRQTVAGAHQEPAHLDGEHPVAVQELRVLQPILVGLVEQSRRGNREAPVGDAVDRHGPYLHVADQGAEGACVLRLETQRWSPDETGRGWGPSAIAAQPEVRLVGGTPGRAKLYTPSKR